MSQRFKRTGDLFSFLNQLRYFKRHQMCLIKDILMEVGIKNSIRLVSFIVLYFFRVSNITGFYTAIFSDRKRKVLKSPRSFVVWTYSQDSRCVTKGQSKMLEMQLDSILYVIITLYNYNHIGGQSMSFIFLFYSYSKAIASLIIN